MTRRARLWLFAPFALGVAALLVWGIRGLPPFGHYHGPYGFVLARVEPHERGATNVVSAVVFDYRGFDTMGEEFIFFASVIGVAMLLRAQRDETEGSPEDRAEGRRLHATADAVRMAALSMVIALTVLGLYVVAHGQLTPGGGFQGGIVLAGAPLMIYLAGRVLVFEALNPVPLLEGAKSTGAAGFVVMGFVGLFVGAAFLSNVIPLAPFGSIFSGGDIPILNVAVGLEVAAGTVLVIHEYLEQTLVIRGSR